MENTNVASFTKTTLDTIYDWKIDLQTIFFRISQCRKADPKIMAQGQIKASSYTANAL